MKKYFLLIFIYISVITLNAQWDVSISMGLDYKYASSYRDYINYDFPPSEGELPSFTTAVNFSGEIDHLISESFMLGLEYSILIDSYTNSNLFGGVYDLSYTNHRPSVLAYYVLNGNGYKFKFGGGLGLRFISLDEQRYSITTNFTAVGAGFILKAEGNTALGDNLFALIGIDFRYDLPGELQTSDNQKLINKSTDESVNMNSLGIGIKLGITYSF
jgi:hypothetical protein